MNLTSEKGSLFLPSDDSITENKSNINEKQRMLINPTTGDLEPLNDLLIEPQGSFNNIEQVLANANNEQNSNNQAEVYYDENEMEEDDNIDEDDAVSEASSNLLMGTRSIPKIRINYNGSKYGLFSNVPVNNGSDATLQHFSIKPEISFKPMNATFQLIRDSLLLYLPNTQLASSELILSVAELDLELQEDNIYNKKITLQDIVAIYKSLLSNTPGKEGDSNYQDDENPVLNFNITCKKRFLNRYNELVELVDNGGNLNHVFKFSNSSGDPVVLDDDDYETIDKRIINKSPVNSSDSDIEIID